MLSRASILAYALAIAAIAAAALAATFWLRQ
jgi:hypothetical protein